MEITGGKDRGRQIAIARKGDLKGKIGSLVFFTFGSMEVPVEEVVKYWNETTLPDYLMPTETTPSDAFANTCSSENIDIWMSIDAKVIEEFEEIYKDAKVRVEYVTLPVKGGSSEYILIRRIWLSEGETEGETEVTPQHPNVARLKFNPADDRIEVIPFEEYESSGMKKQIERVANAEYQRQKTVINRAHHAQAFRRLVYDVYGCPFGYGSGCVYVPNEGESKVESFKSYINEVASRYGTTGHFSNIRTVPAVDSQEMREDIARDVAREVEKAFEAILRETISYIQRQKDTDDEKVKEAQDERVEGYLAKALRECERLKIMKKEYENALDTKVRLTLAEMKFPRNATGRAKALLAEMAKTLKG